MLEELIVDRAKSFCRSDKDHNCTYAQKKMKSQRKCIEKNSITCVLRDNQGSPKLKNNNKSIFDASRITC